MFFYYKFYTGISLLPRRLDYANRVILTYNKPNYYLIAYNNFGKVENTMNLQDVFNKDFSQLTPSERAYIAKKALDFKGDKLLDIYHQDNIESNFRDTEGKIRKESVNLYTGSFISKPTIETTGISQIQSLDTYSADFPDTFYIDFTAFPNNTTAGNCFEVLLDVGSSMNGFSIILSIIGNKRNIAFVSFKNNQQSDDFTISNLNIDDNKRYGVLFEIYSSNGNNFARLYQIEKDNRTPISFVGNTPSQLNNVTDWSDNEETGVGKQVKTVSNITLNNPPGTQVFKIQDFNGEINSFSFFPSKTKDEVWQDAQFVDMAFIYPLVERDTSGFKKKEINLLDNLQRTNPQYFDETYVINSEDELENKTTEYVTSIDNELNKINKSINCYLLEPYILSHFNYQSEGNFYRLNNDYEITKKHCRRFNVIPNRVFWTDQWYVESQANNNDYELYYYRDFDEVAYKSYSWFLSNLSFFLNFYFSYDYLRMYMLYTFGVDVVRVGETDFLETFTERYDNTNINEPNQKYLYNPARQVNYITYSSRATLSLTRLRINFQKIREKATTSGEPDWDSVLNLETIMGVISNYYPLEDYVLSYNNKDYNYNFVSKEINEI